MANNEIVLDLLEAGELERAKDVVAWLIWAAKSYGVKAVNPGGVTAWKWGKDAKTLFDPVPGYSKVTPATIIASLAQIVDQLGLPHPLHLHCNNLGAPGNVATTIETMKVLEGNRAHMAHLQFHSYGGDDWDTMKSEAATIAEYFNAHPNLTADAGAILFGNAVTVTADGPWQHFLYQLTGRKWGNLDVENETGCGIVPYTYKRKQPGQRRSMGGGTGALAADHRPVAHFPDHRSSQRRLFLALPGDHSLADERRSAAGTRQGTAAQGARADASWRTWIGSTRCRRSPSITSAGPSASPRPDPERTPRLGRRRRPHHLQREAGRRTSVPVSAVRASKAGEIVVEEGDIRNISDGRGFRRSARVRPSDRGVFEAVVSAVLHHVLRELSGGDWIVSNGRKSVPANKRRRVA